MRLSHEADRSCALTLSERGRASIGRQLGCDLVITDPFVSRVHATIERFDERHLLQDASSSNGTYLNGLRLNPVHAFALRDGDLIEIGRARLVYGQDVGATDSTSQVLRRVERSYALGNLLREAGPEFGGSNGSEDQALVERAMASVPRPAGIVRCLELLGARAAAQTVAFFGGLQGVPLELLGAFPDASSGRNLAMLAARSWAERSALHLEAADLERVVPLDETAVVPVESSLALPFFRHERGCVVVVARTVGDRFDRRALRQCAALAERIARCVCVGSLRGSETPFGYGGVTS